MLNFLQDAIAATWEILLAVPMPWRAGLLVSIAAIGGYQVVRRLLILLLLPEFWITNRLRCWGHRPLPGTYAFDDLVEWSIKILRAFAWLALLALILGLTAWYARPSLEDTALAQYIDQGIDWWYSLEESVLAGG